MSELIASDCVGEDRTDAWDLLHYANNGADFELVSPRWLRQIAIVSKMPLHVAEIKVSYCPDDQPQNTRLQTNVNCSQQNQAGTGECSVCGAFAEFLEMLSFDLGLDSMSQVFLRRILVESSSFNPFTGRFLPLWARWSNWTGYVCSIEIP